MLLASGCHNDEKSRLKLESMKNDPQATKYAIRLAEMSYLTGRKPDKTYAYTLIRNFIKDGYFTEARYAIDHLVDLYGPDADMYYLEAVCFRNQHEYKQALTFIGEALKLENSNGLFEMEKSNIVEEQRKWNEIDSLNTLVGKHESNYGLRLERSQKLLGMREFEAAIFDADTVLRADSTNLQARFVKGISFLLDGKYDKALPEFEILVARTTAPDYEDYTFYYGIAQRLVDNADQLKKNPLSPAPYINVARALARISEYTNALITLDKGLSKIPDNNNLLYAKALVFLQKGDKNAARDLVYILEGKGVNVDPAVKKAVE